MRLSDGGHFFDATAMDSLPWLGEGDDLMKIVHVDEDIGQVIFVQRFGAQTQQPTHTHHCTAIAYTIDGAWEYNDARFPKGAVVFEPPGSTHFAATGEGQTAEVLVILTALPGSSRLLEVTLGDRSIEFDVAMFKKMSKMPSNAAWLEYAERAFA